MPLGSDFFADADLLILDSPSEETSNATLGLQSGEPVPAGWETTFFRTAWWKFSVTESGWYRVDTFDSTGGADTVLTVYHGDALDSLTSIGTNDDTDDPDAPDLLSSVVIWAWAGVTYYVQVASFDDNPAYGYVATLTASDPPVVNWGSDSSSIAQGGDYDAPGIVTTRGFIDAVSPHAGTSGPLLYSDATAVAWWRITPGIDGVMRVRGRNGDFAGVYDGGGELITADFGTSPMYVPIAADQDYNAFVLLRAEHLFHPGLEVGWHADLDMVTLPVGTVTKQPDDPDFPNLWQGSGGSGALSIPDDTAMLTMYGDSTDISGNSGAYWSCQFALLDGDQLTDFPQVPVDVQLLTEVGDYGATPAGWNQPTFRYETNTGSFASIQVVTGDDYAGGKVLWTSMRRANTTLTVTPEMLTLPNLGSDDTVPHVVIANENFPASLRLDYAAMRVLFVTFPFPEIAVVPEVPPEIDGIQDAVRRRFGSAR